MTGRFESAGTRLISSMPSPRGSSRSSSNGRGLSVRMRCASFSSSPVTSRGVAGLRERAPQEAEHPPVVVDHQDARRPRVCLSNRRGRSSGGAPRPSPETGRANRAFSRVAAIGIGDDSGTWRAPLARRLPRARARCAAGRPSRAAGKGNVEHDGVPPAAAGGGAARPLDRLGGLGRPGRDRERAGVDAAGVEQAADEAVHVAGLLDDDAVELANPGGVERRPVLEQGRPRAP